MLSKIIWLKIIFENNLSTINVTLVMIENKNQLFL